MVLRLSMISIQAKKKIHSFSLVRLSDWIPELSGTDEMRFKIVVANATVAILGTVLSLDPCSGFNSEVDRV